MQSTKLTAAPWTWEIAFGSRAMLAVYPGKGSGEVIYDLRVRGKPPEPLR